MQIRTHIAAAALVLLAAAQVTRAQAPPSSPSKQPPAPAKAGAPGAPFSSSSEAKNSSTPAGPHVPFIEGKPFAEVLRRAKAENKPIMLDVVAAWCGPCKIMDATTFADSTVIDWAKKNVIPARVDAEKGEGKRISARYQAYSFPTVVFLDANGNEIDRLVGGYGAVDFRRNAELLLAGRTQLLTTLAKLKAAWNADEALAVANALAPRRDLARLRPIALRLVGEEGDLGRPEIFQVFAQLVAIETLDNDHSAETGDLIATFLPRLGNDPRRSFLAAALVTGLGKRGDVAAARTVTTDTLRAVGEDAPYTAEVLAALGAAERAAGNAAEALAAFRRAAALAEKNGAAPGSRVERQFDLAEALAANGKPAEAKKAYAAGTAIGPLDTTLAARAARVALAVKEQAAAVQQARHAVELSGGEDANAQGALAAALRATGDPAGASAALKKAAALEPANPEYRAGTSEAPKKKPAKAS